MKVYTGTSWVAAYVSGETGSYVSISGGTMTGPLTLHGNAVANLHAIPKQQFDIGLAAKADTAHTHAISDVSNLQTALDSKANSLAPNFAGKAQFATGQNFASINIGINTVSTSLADGDLYISGDVLSFRSSGVLFSVASINSGNTYASGARQTMQHTTASSGLRVAPNSYDINTPVDGDIWYNGAAAKLKFRLGSTSQNFAFEGHSHAIADVTNLQTVLDAKAGSASPSFTGLIDFTNGSVRQNAVSIPALAIDCSTGNYFTKSISVNSAFTFTNVPVAGKVYAMTIEIDHVSGSITWPTSVVWPNATAPTLTTGKKHLFFFLTDDGGVVWRAASQTNYAS